MDELNELDELDELLVERELPPRDVVCRQLVAEAVPLDVEEHAFAREAVGGLGGWDGGGWCSLLFF